LVLYGGSSPPFRATVPSEIREPLVTERDKKLAHDGNTGKS